MRRTPSGLLAITMLLLAACGHDPAWAGPSHPWLGTDGNPIAISHEGVRDGQGRITLDGFIAAHDLGFRHMETDLRQVESGELIAFHDVSGDVENRTLAEVRGGAAIAPTVEELLTAPTLHGTKWNFELKGGDVETAAALASSLQSTGAADRVCVSFGTTISPQKVRAMRDALPPGTCVCASLLERATDWDAFTTLSWQVDLDQRVVCTQQASEPVRGAQLAQVGRGDVRQAHERGLALHVYDVLGIAMTESDVNHLLDIGVDGIITDDHEVVKSVFEARGLWPSP